MMMIIEWIKVEPNNCEVANIYNPQTNEDTIRRDTNSWSVRVASAAHLQASRQRLTIWMPILGVRKDRRTDGETQFAQWQHINEWIYAPAEEERTGKRKVRRRRRSTVDICNWTCHMTMTREILEMGQYLTLRESLPGWMVLLRLRMADGEG